MLSETVLEVVAEVRDRHAPPVLTSAGAVELIEVIATACRVAGHRRPAVNWTSQEQLQRALSAPAEEV